MSTVIKGDLSREPEVRKDHLLNGVRVPYPARSAGPLLFLVMSGCFDTS